MLSCDQLQALKVFRLNDFMYKFSVLEDDDTYSEKDSCHELNICQRMMPLRKLHLMNLAHFFKVKNLKILHLGNSESWRKLVKLL